MSSEFIVDNFEEQISTCLVKWLYAQIHTIKGHISSSVLFHHMYKCACNFNITLFFALIYFMSFQTKHISYSYPRHQIEGSCSSLNVTAAVMFKLEAILLAITG